MPDLLDLASGDETFLDPGCWDALSTDAVVQVALFDDVIYG